MTLAIGLAALTSALAMVESLLRAPPFPHHASIVVYGEEDRDPASRAASPLLYDAIGLPPGVVSRGAAQVAESVNVRSGERERLARAQRVDAGFLPTLGVTSILPEDPSIAFDRGIMLSYTFWRHWMGGDPRVVGRRVAINGVAMTVRGVLPADYRFFSDIDVLTPLSLTGLSGDDAANLVAIARLAPGTSADRVARWIQARLVASRVPLRPGCQCLPVYATTPLDLVLTSKAKPVVLLFFCCSLLVLAVAGVNLSNLMLTRALRRTQETCLVIAFGGRGWQPRLPRVLDVIMTSAGALMIGLPLAHVMVVAVRPLVPASWLASALPIELDGRTCAAAALASVAVTVSAALLGSVHTSPDTLLRMQLASGGASPAGLAQRARRLMVLVQTALATVLLVLGVAMVAQWWRAVQVPLGFQADAAGFVEISPDATQFPVLDDVIHADAVIRAAALGLPGIDAAGMTTLLPIGAGLFMPFLKPAGDTSYLQYGMVSPGAMEAMGITRVAGRSMEVGDRAATPAVAVVNQAYLDQIDSHGLGGWVKPASLRGTNRPIRIVGVVADARSAGAEHAAVPTVYVPFAQVDPDIYAFIRRFVPTFFVSRGPGSTAADDATLRKLVRGVVPGLVTGTRRSFRQLAAQATAQARRNASLAVMFAGMALSLAVIGLYAVQSLEVARGRREIALRDALGATPLDLLGHLLSRGLGMAMPGVAVGLVVAVVLGRVVVHPALERGVIDVGVVAAVALLMIAAALAAVALPSLHAAAVRPATILRGELMSPRGSRHREGIPR
ncbi:hypothetical protein Y886_21425 [Xanthomonas hyacinthi DSM 19077]|nr:hypothetical protein Y886_21425 [Xanthomonas hyacinthi DSM 19077]